MFCVSLYLNSPLYALPCQFRYKETQVQSFEFYVSIKNGLF
jgi:hypothetical protein